IQVNRRRDESHRQPFVQQRRAGRVRRRRNQRRFGLLESADAKGHGKHGVRVHRATTTTPGDPRMPSPDAATDLLAAVRKSPGNRVKVAVSDIDGVLRCKYLHKDKFESALEGGFGFCDVVFGWDCHDQCYDNTTYTGWHKGFPDALARIDLGT